ncbi:MAG TPA: tRNA (adenosine(37)-N6)-threonylcarbamoyltransferase complex dimerization subunit type 1 TsaB [Anaeromyxobacteraceae bacterium]|nr:tRNA (adenosine(37)-N6)-threonylcarbamoyltransferase complex dimerization subunit type 1 TsaB [Anaeromyxobacteraceae bacterium]
MLVASIDTATLTLSVALSELGAEGVRIVAERSERAAAKPGPQGPTGGHGGRLPGVLLDLLAEHGRSLEEIDGYAVGLGPGSFTGLRIGLATWKGLAYAQQRPLVGASSLAAMAAAAAPVASRGALLVPLLDAKKAEVYAGFYRVGEGERLQQFAPEAALRPEALLAYLEALAADPSEIAAFGEGYAAYRGPLAALPELPGGPPTPPGHAVARLCAARLASAPYDPQALFALEPHYVRPSEAELKFPGGTVPRPGG